MVILRNNKFRFITNKPKFLRKYVKLGDIIKTPKALMNLMDEIIHYNDISRKVLYAAYAAGGIEMLGRYFRETNHIEDRELYSRVYNLIPNHHLYSIQDFGDLVNRVMGFISPEPPIQSKQELSPEPEIIFI